MCALPARGILFFSVMRGLSVSLAILSTWALISCIYSEIPGFRPLEPGRSDGKYLHQYSDFVFPTKIGHFLRVSMNNLDPHGVEVSVVYNSDSGILLTVYVYPTRRYSYDTGRDPLEEHFRGVRDMAVRNSPDARLISDGPSRVKQNGKSYTGRRAVMSLEDFRAKATRSRKRPKGISELIIFRLGDFFIKYRITYSEAIEIKAEREINDFMSALRWPAEVG